MPRTSVEGFLESTQEHDYGRAAEYLDLRNLPRGISRSEGPALARKLKIVLDRSTWIDPNLISDHPRGHQDDGLPAYRDLLARLETQKGSYDILLQRVPRGDGVYIWKFSNATVAKIPELYGLYGYGRIGDFLSKNFPDLEILGLQIWQWVGLVCLVVLSFLAALFPMWVAAMIVRRKETDLRNRLASFLMGPVWIFLGLLLYRASVELVSPTLTFRAIMEANTGPIIVGTWVILRFIDLLAEALKARLKDTGREEATFLFRPTATTIKIVVVLIAVMVWLDNMGFKVSTILASLGVGGLAVALAAQDTLKNFFGSIMILVDKPYQVGQRIVVKGHDGVVEEIGLRSTRLRLLTGHQTTIPNDEMARLDIENVERRPHIRRRSSIQITYDTPLEKIKEAVKIIQDILDNHEGMSPDFPPRVYFNEFNRDSLSILMFYWYHPADYWAFNAFNEKGNLRIMEAFESRGIEFAFPTTTTYLARDKQRPLEISIAGNSESEA